MLKNRYTNINSIMYLLRINSFNTNTNREKQQLKSKLNREV